MNQTSKYIVIEGIDGSGKTTQLELLSKNFTEKNIPFYRNIEPSANPIGKFIRETILSGEYDTNELVRQTLFLADRFDTYYNGDSSVMKMLEKGHVIADRSFISGMTYGGAHGFYIHDQLSDHLLFPDLVIYLDVLPEDVMKRIDSSRESKEVYENLAFQVDLKDRYEEVLEHVNIKYGISVLRVRGDLEPDLVSKVIWGSVFDIL